jgi:hypothetical protein
MYRCIKKFSLEKCDENGIILGGEFIVIKEGSVWYLPEEIDHRTIGSEVRLECDELDEVGWIEIRKETLEEYFEVVLTWEEAEEVMINGGVIESQVSFIKYEILKGGTMLANGQVIEQKSIKDEEYDGCWKQVDHLKGKDNKSLMLQKIS